MNKFYPPIIFIIILFLAAFTGCKKDPLYIDLHKDTIIAGNKSPQYNGVTNLQIRLYINKIYVDLVGREPTTAELDAKTNYLIQHNLDSAARDVIISELLNTHQYYVRLFEITSSYMLNSADSNAIYEQTATLGYAKYLDSLNGGTTGGLYFTFEITRLLNLYYASDDLHKGKINIREYFRRFLDNYFYDQINMGSENFVKAAFDNLFGRQPTENELSEGVKMSDGQSAILFTQNGNSKPIFKNIVTNSAEFIEGLVRKSYIQFLLRQPTSVEMAMGTNEVSQTLNLPAFQKKLILSKEYAGF